MNEITKYDKSFDESVFLTRADHIFIMILDAIMDNDMSSVKHYISENIYNKFTELVNNYKANNYTRIFDEMNVKSTQIRDVSINEDEINIEVIITSRYMDYFLDENGNYVSGINDHRIEETHRLVFTKYINSKDLKEARRCPSCGSTLDINNSGVCPYCRQTIDMSNYDYIVTEMNTF